MKSAHRAVIAALGVISALLIIGGLALVALAFVGRSPAAAEVQATRKPAGRNQAAMLEVLTARPPASAAPAAQAPSVATVIRPAGATLPPDQAGAAAATLPASESMATPATVTPPPASPAESGRRPVPPAAPASPVPTATNAALPGRASPPAATPTARATQAIATPRPATATRTPRPSETPTQPSLGEIRGRVVAAGTPASGGVVLRLQKSDSGATVAQAQVAEGGVYTFTGITACPAGYVVAFTQDDNPGQQDERYMPWAWLGPVLVRPGESAVLPDLEIGRLGFLPELPGFGSTLSLAGISAQSPVTFTWTAYPGATAYWVDVYRGPDLQPTWQSALMAQAAAQWDGAAADGGTAPAGEYWWGVGARRTLGAYTLTAYGYLASLTVTP